MGYFWLYPAADLNDHDRATLLGEKLHFFATTAVGSVSRITVTSGTMIAGGAGVLDTDDDIYQQVRSTVSGTTSWNGRFSGVPNSLRKLEGTYKGSNSRACTQRIRIWNWRTAAWVGVDRRTVASSEVEIIKPAPGSAPADYVSGTTGTGELRLRISCQRDSQFTANADLLRIVYNRS
jgi:hypothetical protein